MSFVRRNALVGIVTAAWLGVAPIASGQVCVPSPDGAACTPLACSTIPEDQCIATVVHIDWATGAITAQACECMNFNFCHVEFGNASPHAVGECPDGGTCQVVGMDTDNDGQDDTFTAGCMPAGVCCLDIDDGPVPFDTCMNLGQADCEAQGGIFHPSDSTCDRVQACCMAFAGAEFCADLVPECCILSGGVPLGPNTACADIACPPICGGLVGIPCTDPNTFCRFPDGTCESADLFGVCMPVPNGCPDVWDPVCGCDGVTYGNACEAAAARMSIDHYGACEPFCRPLDDGSGCTPLACSAIPEDQCLAMAMHRDPNSAAPVVLACDCINFNFCHLETGGAGGPVAVGDCPDGGVCTAVGVDTNGDGIDDLFEAHCAATGGCCSDVSGSPLPLPICTETTEDNCPGPNAHFKGPGTTCDPTQACCMPLGGEPYCVDTDPFCCLAFGGVPQGPDTSCAAGGCGHRCGGPDGLPCDTTTSFCKYPEGTCGQGGEYGVCTERPTGCPDVWDPVCGCDGQTYGNECDADAAGVSVRHRGECGRACDGLGPMPPCFDGEFCKYPESTCGAQGVLGICTPIPTACPEYYDPVCACNGVTYGNECEADAAATSLLHHGLCEWTCCDPAAAPPCPVEPVCCAGGYWACPDDPTVPACPDGPGRVCGPVCGGFIGIPCPAADQFCKFSDGTCEWADHYGMCTHIPSEGCPENYDPVCGCDGVTYDNECFADAAMMSIAHRGPCDQCSATRLFANATDVNPSYCPGVEKLVHIVLDIPPGVDAVALEDAPPAGWLVTQISHGGTFDYVHGKVKWGPFFAPNFPPAVSYVAIPPEGEDGVRCFEGTISLDGLNSVICGAACLERHCRLAMEADSPQPACAACPGGDCSTCSDNGCQNGRISLCELVTYACSWKAGCHDDMSGMARAAFVWRNGECYCWDDAGQNWFPADCPAPPTGLCGRGSAGQSQGRTGTATVEWTSGDADRTTRSSRMGGRTEVIVSVSIAAPAGTTAVALDMEIPRGWRVVRSSDDGEWDNVNRKVKWGPFFDELSRTVTFKLVSVASKVTTQDRSDLTAKPRLGGLSGTVSFDGINVPITAK